MRASRRDYQEIVKLVRMMEKSTTRRLMWAHALAKLTQRGAMLSLI